MGSKMKVGTQAKNEALGRAVADIIGGDYTITITAVFWLHGNVVPRSNIRNMDIKLFQMRALDRYPGAIRGS